MVQREIQHAVRGVLSWFIKRKGFLRLISRLPKLRASQEEGVVVGGPATWLYTPAVPPLPAPCRMT